MKRTVIIWSCVLALCGGATGLNAQNLGVTATVGLGTYRMDDMKYLLESIMETYPVEARVISSFPAYTSTSAGMVKRLYPHVKVGAAYGFSTSGSKADYSDYSGAIRTTIVAVSHRLGALAAYTPLSGERLELSVYGRIDLNMTRMDVSSYLVAAGYSSGVENKYRAFSPQLSAFAELLYNLGRFSLGIEGGYLVDIPGELKGSGGGPDLTDPAGGRELLTSDWTGWRTGIKMILWLDFPEP